MAWMTREKENFFKELDQLDCWADDSDGEFERVIASSRQKDGNFSAKDFSHHLSSRAPSPHSGPALRRASHTSIIEVDKCIPIVTTDITNELHSHNTSTAKQSKTMSGKSPTGHSSVTSKRRKTSSGKIIPEQRQIFKGLVFFFFPNSDVSRLRRLRIQRAQEYGAQWARVWGNTITHVIVDKGLTFQEVLKHMGLESFPPAIAIVDECYPSECIKFRSVLSLTHVRFQVNGASGSSENTEPLTIVEPSPPGSLPLKLDRREEPRTQTPSRIPDSQDDLPGNILYLQVDHSRDVPGHVENEALPVRERDILDDMIEAAKAMKDLPLDALDDDTSVETSDNEASETSDSGPTRQKRRKVLQTENAAVESWQQKFICMQKHDSASNSGNPNSRTIEVLQQMSDYYTRTSDHWRSLAYRKAISALRRQPKKVITRSQALTIPGVGPRLADKIEEIVFTNRLRRLESTNTTAEDQILQNFLGVYGAGISHASRWIAQGYKSLEDLQTKAPLTQSQRIGVEHYYDFSQRIPRGEVEAHGAIVRRVVQKVNPRMQVIIGGSYRRGAVDSGDIDLIITRPDAAIEEIRTIMIDIVVPELFRFGFLQASLASTSRGDGSKWHGASKLPGSRLWRRIDLLFVPGAEIGAALLYFTGNDIFNRSMRLLASKKSMRLNQRGLYVDVFRGPQRAKINPGRLVESHDERRIFQILGVPWRPPEHRIC